MNPYDQLPYDSFPCPTSHPDGLAAIARIFGLQPAPVTACRVLELGCGTGANLVPMAAALPGSRFVGVDLSAVQIEIGRRDVAALGLANIALETGDLAALPADLGAFDFVIAHGVFSWVPRETQEALLRSARACLAESGVAYVSYAALPGARPRQALREMLAWGARAETEPLRRVARARRFAEILAAHLADRATGAAALRKLIGELGGMSDAYVLHDYLSPVHEPSTLSDFVARAAAHDLQYLGDAQFPAMFPGDLEAEALEAARGLATDQLAFEQLLDFLAQRPFRTSLLCRGACALDRRLSHERLRGLFLTTRARPRGKEDDHWTFRAEGGEVFGTPSTLVAAALRHLADEHPRPVLFEELCDRARAAVDSQPASAADVELLGANLLSACANDQATLGTWDRGVRSRADGEGAPLAFSVARLQAARGASATNLWHRSVALGPAQRQLLPLLDGRRRGEALLEAARAKEPRADAGWLDSQLASLAANAFLLAGGRAGN